jgi:hypothetical protein
MPGLVGIEVLRVSGAGAALLVACFHVTALLHDTGAATRRVAVRAAIAVPLLYVPSCAIVLGSALLLLRFLGTDLGTFRELVTWGDLGRGVIGAVGIAPLAAGWTFLGARLFRTARWGLSTKLFATWIVVSIGSMILASLLTAVTGASDAPPGFD